MGESEMEKAYRRRSLLAMLCLLLLAFLSILVGHFLKGVVAYPFLAMAAAFAVIATRADRILFPHAWRTFDAPRPSPVLEEEARSLARTMGVRISGLRLLARHSDVPTWRWRGQMLLVSPSLRDLPSGERRFALAMAIAGMPNLTHLFVIYTAQPLLYLAFAAWLWGYRAPAVVVGFVAIAWAVRVVVRFPSRQRAEQARALAATVDLGSALAYWRRLHELGSTRAAKEIASLEAQGVSL